MSEDRLNSNTPIAESGLFDERLAKALAGHWIATVGQFLVRAASQAGRRALAEAAQVDVSAIEDVQRKCLEMLPPDERKRLEETAAATMPIPPMGLLFDSKKIAPKGNDDDNAS
ncbi:MAG: hypothetical protein NTX50_05840 [Candidatus Sumerlaeota bacterium]|nr:hypothetical protein [Candidatus Sumerlaeota bacterium]